MICLIRGVWLKNINRGNVPVTGTFLYSDKIDCIYKGGRSEAKRNYAITMVLVWYYYGNGMVL